MTKKLPNVLFVERQERKKARLDPIAKAERQKRKRDKKRSHLRGRRAGNIQRAREWVHDFKLDNGCSSCPERDPACLDFHHRQGTYKIATVSSIVTSGNNLHHVVDEVAKCIVLCANCHRKHHDAERASKRGLIELRKLSGRPHVQQSLPIGAQ